MGLTYGVLLLIVRAVLISVASVRVRRELVTLHCA